MCECEVTSDEYGLVTKKKVTNMAKTKKKAKRVMVT